jgi:hypothetical protein
LGSEKSYQIEISGQSLVFRTSSVKAEKGSVLHSGIFNRELASLLAAGTIMIFLGLFFAGYGRIQTLHVIAGIVLFAMISLLLRKHLFHEPMLRAIFDGKKGILSIAQRGILFQKREGFSLTGLSGIALNRVVLRPENPDGIEIVEKIALHHFVVIPGFGETEEFFTVQLDFGEKSVMLFSSRKKEEAEEVHGRLKSFIDAQRAPQLS